MGDNKEMKPLNKKAQVESGVFQNLVIGVIVITALVVLSVGFMGNLQLNYGGDVNTAQIASLSKYNEINETIGAFSDKIQGRDDQQPESTNIIDLIILAGYGTIKLMFDVPEILTGMISGAASTLGLPSIVVWMLASIVLVMVIFAAFAVIMKVRA